MISFLNRMEKKVKALNNSRTRRNNFSDKEFKLLGELNGIVLLESTDEKGLLFKIDAESFWRNFETNETVLESILEPIEIKKGISIASKL